MMVMIKRTEYINNVIEAADIIRTANEDTIIVVNSIVKRELILRAIERMKPGVKIEVHVC